MLTNAKLQPRIAYLLVRLRERKGRMPEVMEVRIYSEATPTSVRGDHYAFLMSRAGDGSYASARKAVIDSIRDHRHDLAWVLPLLGEDA